MYKWHNIYKSISRNSEKRRRCSVTDWFYIDDDGNKKKKKEDILERTSWNFSRWSEETEARLKRMFMDKVWYVSDRKQIGNRAIKSQGSSVVVSQLRKFVETNSFHAVKKLRQNMREMQNYNLPYPFL